MLRNCLKKIVFFFEIESKKFFLTSKTKRLAKYEDFQAQVRELTDQMLRSAFRDHSRDMETHLRDIDERLKALERKR